MKTVFATKFEGRRLRVRKANVEAVISIVRDDALKRKDWSFYSSHGGSVANKYGYPAETEVVFAAGDPSGNVVVFCERLPANKVTLGGAAAACLPCARPLFDRRYGKDAKEKALQACRSECSRLLEKLQPDSDVLVASKFSLS